MFVAVQSVKNTDTANQQEYDAGKKVYKDPGSNARWSRKACRTLVAAVMSTVNPPQDLTLQPLVRCRAVSWQDTSLLPIVKYKT